MSLEENILELNKQDGFFVSSLDLDYHKSKHVLYVTYASLFGLFDIYNIKEGINQREETNHVKYKYHHKTLTILVDKSYTWASARTTSTDILRLPDDLEDVKLEFFND